MIKKIYRIFIGISIFLVLIYIGTLFGKLIINIIDKKITVIEAISDIALFTVFFILFYILNIILHEVGHLVCGLISGYKFSSFTIGNIILIKKNNKLEIKKFHIPGTGGQCLMSPPPYSDGKFAYKLYLLGGVLINLAGVILAFLVLLLKNDAGLIANSFILSGICIILANIRINGLGEVDTDLTVLVSAQDDIISRKAFWIQLYVAARQNEDVEIGALPKDMLILPDNFEISNNLRFYWYYIVCIFEFKNENYTKYRKMVDSIKDKIDLMKSIYMNELLCELLFLDIIEMRYIHNKEYWDTLNLRAYIEKTKGYLSRQRLLYAYSLLVLNNSKKANLHLRAFEKIIKKWPYLSDIQDEIRLIDLIKRIASQ
ncbi:MAG: hypothetical protein ACLSW1_07485 [Lachnospira sp.]